MPPSIDISKINEAIVQSILRQHLEKTSRVWVFGSRATWQAKDYSDLDLAIQSQGKNPLSLHLITTLATAFENSDLPWKVDVVDFNTISDEFKVVVDRDKAVFPVWGMGGEWVTTSVGELCSFVTSGGTPKTSNKDFYNKGTIPWLNTKEVNFSRIWNTKKSITEKGLNGSSAKRIPKDSVIVAMYGATAGKVAVNKIPLTTNQACCNLVIDPNKADYNFVYYYLSLNYSKLLDLANGAAQQNLNSLIIKTFPIRVPTLESQKAISHILGSLDDKIELNRQTNQTLEAMATALFKSWFVDFDPVIDNALAAGNEIPEALQAKAEARKALGDKRKALPEDIRTLFPSSFVHTVEMGWIPEGWEVDSIKHLCEKVESGGTPSRKELSYWDLGTIPWLTSGEVNQDIIIKTKKFITSEGLENSSAKIWPKMSTIVAMYGATAGKITLLACETSANQACCALIPKKNSKSFVYYKAKDSVSKYESRARGSAQQNLNKSIVSELESLIPSKHILDCFEKEIGAVLVKIISAKTTNLWISDLRDTLLPKLISGELRVPDVEKLIEEAGV